MLWGNHFTSKFSINFQSWRLPTRGYWRSGLVYAAVSGLVFSGLKGKHEISEVVYGIRKVNNRMDQKLKWMVKNVKQMHAAENGFTEVRGRWATYTLIERKTLWKWKICDFIVTSEGDMVIRPWILRAKL
jgi:hypothetical protein